MSDASPTAGETVSGADAASSGAGNEPTPAVATGFPGADRLPAAAQRPEVLIGAAFGGAFIVARILKRIFD